MSRKKEVVVKQAIVFDNEAVVEKANSVVGRLNSLIAEYEANKKDPVLAASIVSAIDLKASIV